MPTMLPLTRASATQGPYGPPREMTWVPRAIVALLLGVIVLMGLPHVARTQQAQAGGRDARTPHGERGGPLQDNDRLALNAPGIDALPSDPLKRGRFVVELIGLPAALTPGQIGKVRVRVSTAEGQDVPTDLPDRRGLWIDLILLDANGRELFRRGAIKAARALDGLGFVVPSDTVGPVTVLADLSYSPVAPGPAGDDPSEPQSEITRLASAADRVPVLQMRAGAAKEVQRLLLLLALGRPRTD